MQANGPHGSINIYEKYFELQPDHDEQRDRFNIEKNQFFHVIVVNSGAFGENGAHCVCGIRSVWFVSIS